MTLETLLLQKQLLLFLVPTITPALDSTVKTIIYLWRGKQ